MQNTIYTTQELLAVRRHIYVPKTFLLDSLFSRQMLSSKREFKWEEIVGTRSIAPWAVSTSEGAPIATFGSDIKTFRTGGIKMEDTLNPEQFSERMAGLGELAEYEGWTPERRWAAYIVDVIRQQKAAAKRTLEKMAWNIVTDGTVTIAGVQYPTETLDFLRHDDLTRTLDAADQWDVSENSPLKVIQEIRNLMRKTPFGGPLTGIVMGYKAWEALQGNGKIKDLLDKNFRSTQNININRGLHQGIPYEVQGYLAPGLPVATFSDQYEEKDPTTGLITLKDYLDPRDVIFLGPNAGGRQCYSPVYNFHAGLKPYQYFQKMITNPKGTAQSIYAELNPLLVLLGANNTGRVRVVADKE